MPVKRVKRKFKICISLGLLGCFSAWPAPDLPLDRLTLEQKYTTVKTHLTDNAFGLPLHIESQERKNALTGEVYGVFDHAFADVRKALETPEAWCDFALLHLNIKTCTLQKNQDQTLLTFYSGRKFYQAPSEAYPIVYQFDVKLQGPHYLQIILSAAKGPIGTKNHCIAIEAIPIAEGKTFIHIHYSYDFGFSARFAMSSYFATLGSGKIGFSIAQINQGGTPVYVDGTRGAIERNAVRYFLAIQAYLDSLQVPEPERFQFSLNQWFDLTDRFKTQLFEISKNEYIQGKLREHRNQMDLQANPAGKFGSPTPVPPYSEK